MEKRFGLRFDPLNEIVPLIGSKEGISHLALAYLEPGGIAIIPEPGYNAYQGGTLLASGEPYRYRAASAHGFPRRSRRDPGRHAAARRGCST